MPFLRDSLHLFLFICVTVTISILGYISLLLSQKPTPNQKKNLSNFLDTSWSTHSYFPPYKPRSWHQYHYFKNLHNFCSILNKNASTSKLYSQINFTLSAMNTGQYVSDTTQLGIKLQWNSGNKKCYFIISANKS